ncbi:hypothetical protein [Raoultibacter phocaeensis]|uniref:hypothetical protein n=1 Tax=Raoultibacter phocaeensis TaxID=2479841 RepID=UPI001118F317|nr:hypothetical protein [Raoultibacter phocaeensis]
MKKTKTGLTVLALTAALALGAAPAALAVEGDAQVNTTGNIAADGTASTTLNVYATQSQIQATIPVDITVVTPARGGIITAPTAEAYRIVNNGSDALKVTEIRGVDGSGWKAVTTLTENVADITATTGELAMTVKAGSSAALPVDSAAATTIAGANADYFTVAANGGTLGLTLAGESKVKSTLTGDTAYRAIQIAYTVSV